MSKEQKNIDNNFPNKYQIINPNVNQNQINTPNQKPNQNPYQNNIQNPYINHNEKISNSKEFIELEEKLNDNNYQKPMNNINNNNNNNMNMNNNNNININNNLYNTNNNNMNINNINNNINNNNMNMNIINNMNNNMNMNMNMNMNINIQLNESKQEYDLKESDIEDIEKLTNSKILCNIGYGGFSTVKLIFNNQQKSYFAMKVVNLFI